jgi:hypothetical protein
MIDCLFNINSVAFISRVILLARKKCKIIMTCILYKVAEQTRTPVIVTVVIGSLESMCCMLLYNTLTVSHSAFQGRTNGRWPSNASAAAAAVIAKRDAEFRARYVVVPPGDEAKLVSCPICEKTVKSEFLEDDED